MHRPRFNIDPATFVAGYLMICFALGAVVVTFING